MTGHIAMTSKTVTLPLDAGGGWHLFTFDYMTQDGMFSGYLHALDMGHAEQLLSEMKATAVLAGQMIEAEIPEYPLINLSITLQAGRHHYAGRNPRSLLRPSGQITIPLQHHKPPRTLTPLFEIGQRFQRRYPPAHQPLRAAGQALHW